MNGSSPSVPFVLFHRPGAATLEKLIPDPNGDACFRMHPWEGAQAHSDVMIRGRIEPGASVFGDQRPRMKPDATTIGGTLRQDHMDRVALAKTRIEAGEFEKVVLSSRLTVGVQILEAEDVVRRQAQAHPDSFSWVVRHPEIGMWFGSSPEPLVEGQRPHFHTACLAGTRMTHTGARTDPWTPKELHEQQLVTDTVLRSLEHSECQNIEVGPRETVQYGPIEHLRTIVKFSATQPVAQVISALHPTPAVGGVPKDAALSFINSHEGHDRAFYTGWVGLEQGDTVSYYVNLRCASLQENHLTAYAGGGITNGSDPAAEWQETRNKLTSVLDPIVHWVK